MMNYRREYLEQTDQQLLSLCDVHTYRSSGPGGQHRNKVSSAVRLVHRPTGVTAHGDESRSQHQNKRVAVKRLRMNIACRIRKEIHLPCDSLPPVLAECTFRPRGRGAAAPKRLEVGTRDHRFWTVAASLLDVLEANEGGVAPAAGHLGITTGNLTSLFRSDRHLLAAAQAIRRRFGRRPLR